MKKQRFIIKSHVYPLEVMVLYGHSFKEAERILKSVLPDELHNEINELKVESGATSLMFSNGTSVIYFKPGIPNENLGGIVVHECFHTTCSILNTLDLFLTATSEEAFAYLIQYLYEEIEKKIKWNV